jgi:ABC-2 type transport system ATP-binding protein
MAVLETTALTRRFGALTAVDSVSLSVAPGQSFGLLGPNGAGKSTLIKMLTTLMSPSSGGARVGGYDVVRQPGEVRRIIGYVPQMVSADSLLSGYENLLVFARLYDIPSAERRDRARQALAFMGLAEAGDRLVQDYSGGMIRRLEIAQSWLHRPRVLFLDEPTVGLDPLARKTVWEHLERLRADSGVTIILTTHHMDEADRLCGRLAIMHRGRTVAEGSPGELKASLGRPDATLDDVFAHYAGSPDSGGSYREAKRTRRTARRLG